MVELLAAVADPLGSGRRVAFVLLACALVCCGRL
jgi:hypothetical protein